MADAQSQCGPNMAARPLSRCRGDEDKHRVGLSARLLSVCR